MPDHIGEQDHVKVKMAQNDIIIYMPRIFKQQIQIAQISGCKKTKAKNSGHQNQQSPIFWSQKKHMLKILVNYLSGPYRTREDLIGKRSGMMAEKAKNIKNI